MTTLSLPSDRLSQGIKSFGMSVLQIASFTALTAIAAHIRIPIPGNPVPITLQSLAVVLAGAMLGAKRGALSQILLIVLGSLGFSVFSQPSAGLAVILGPTGGYIFGFVLAAFVAGWMSENVKRSSFVVLNLNLFLASLFIFIPGVIWLSTFTGKNLWIAFQLGFLPFVVGDVLKTFIAATVLRLSDKIRN